MKSKVQKRIFQKIQAFFFNDSLIGRNALGVKTVPQSKAVGSIKNKNIKILIMKLKNNNKFLS